MLQNGARDASLFPSLRAQSQTRLQIQIAPKSEVNNKVEYQSRQRSQKKFLGGLIRRDLRLPGQYIGHDFIVAMYE